MGKDVKQAGSGDKYLALSLSFYIIPQMILFSVYDIAHKVFLFYIWTL